MGLCFLIPYQPPEKDTNPLPGGGAALYMTPEWYKASFELQGHLSLLRPWVPGWRSVHTRSQRTCVGERDSGHRYHERGIHGEYN